MDLKEARKLKGLTQLELAQITFVREVTINEIELGKVFPNKSTRRHIEFAVGPIDFVSTRLRHLEAKNGSGEVATAILDYIHSSTATDRATKIRFLREIIKRL